jgi:hypothetical protein
MLISKAPDKPQHPVNLGFMLNSVYPGNIKQFKCRAGGVEVYNIFM